MNPAFQTPIGPVPLEKHYEVFKTIEDKIMNHLESLAQGYLLIGLRVAYDEKDSSNEPGQLPYSVEFGYLGLVDLAARCLREKEETSEEELIQSAMQSPTPIQLLDDLYEYAKAELQSAAGADLIVGVSLELKSSLSNIAAIVVCSCNGVPGRKLRLVYNSILRRYRWVCRAGC
ncbi:MAG: hypothetical protein HZB18_13550 [Chloroflexi bacterium]|nr:hypothetical protein [Chloroflexota bacterium]